MRIKDANGYAAAILALAFAAPTMSFAFCQNSNAALQQQCLAMEAQQRAQQEAQQRAQQEAQRRAQQEAQQRAQQEAQQRAQQEAQQRAQQEAQQRAQQEAAQQRAQQEAQQRAQQEAQQRAQQEAQQRAQQEAQQRAQQEAQQRAQQQAQQRAQQQTQQRTEGAQQRSLQQAQQNPRQVGPQHASQDAAREAATAQSRPQKANGASKAATQPTAGAPSSRSATLARTKSILLSADTKVVVHPNSSILTVRHTEADGSQVVLKGRFAGGKQVLTGAYVSRRESNGDRTQTFLDGHKIVYSKNGDVARISPNHVTVTTQKAGLRQAVFGDGRPVFRERLEHRAYGTGSHEIVVRTEYARIEVGRPIFYSAPLIRHYDVVSYYGFPVLAYEPIAFSPVFLGPFLVGFAQPVVVTASCIFCPAPVVAWQQPVTSYADPVDLVADLQITSAVQDGTADAPPGALTMAASQEDPQVADLRAQVSAMQEQIDAATQSNAELRDQVAQLQQSSPSTIAASFGVPEDVRQQIHRQVRDDIKLHQQGRPLTWPDVVASGGASSYIFQVSDMIDATDSGGEECPLTAGDLLKVEPGTPPDKDVLTLRVITSKSGSCTAGTVIRVSIHDAQGMLNDFNERLEANMQKVQPQIAMASTH
jgi:hypothetical protein